MPQKNSVWDTTFLIAASLVVCVMSVASYAVAGKYRVGPQWVFFGLNVIGFAAIVGRRFTPHWSNPRFVVFLLLWATLHAGLMITVGNAMEAIYWLPIFAGELFAGYLLAYIIFGLPDEPK